MYTDKMSDDGPNTTSPVNKRPYSAVIHDDLMRLQEVAKSVCDKSSTLAGMREIIECCDEKAQEPRNFSETIIRELGVLGDILDDIHKDLDRFM